MTFTPANMCSTDFSILDLFFDKEDPTSKGLDGFKNTLFSSSEVLGAGGDEDVKEEVLDSGTIDWKMVSLSVSPLTSVVGLWWSRVLCYSCSCMCTCVSSESRVDVTTAAGRGRMKHSCFHCQTQSVSCHVLVACDHVFFIIHVSVSEGA